MKLSSAFAASLALVASASPITSRSVQFGWGKEKVRGVNIGGWLVLEPWITPSIFQTFTSQGLGHIIVDEYTLGEHAADQAEKILQEHWDTWVSKADFQKIADNGFNTVRIPVGYWAFKTSPPYYTGNQVDYIDKAIGWARETGLKVWIDLHGAEGSQNGFDNSGHNGTVGWGSGSTVQDTLAVVQLIANRYAQKSYQDVVVGIELLNEPLTPKINGGGDSGFKTVTDFYSSGYADVRKVSDTPVIIQDGFNNASKFDGTLVAPEAQGVVVDHHEYQCFTQEVIDYSPEEHVTAVCRNAASYASSERHWVVVGEWSAAMTDCAAALNGYGLGSRWEGNFPGSQPSTRSCGDINYIDTWNETTITNTKNYINAQLDVFEQRTQGYIFWNFKTEGSAEWDLFRLLDKGVFPNVKNRQATSLCSS